MSLERQLTLFTLHHPYFELDEAVGVKAVILSLAAVPHLMPTQIHLVMREVLTDFGVPDSFVP